MTDTLPVLDALSISQPWAWLIVAPEAAPARKRVENRQWGVAQLAQARLGCYCVARPSEATP